MVHDAAGLILKRPQRKGNPAQGMWKSTRMKQATSGICGPQPTYRCAHAGYDYDSLLLPREPSFRFNACRRKM